MRPQTGTDITFVITADEDPVALATTTNACLAQTLTTLEIIIARAAGAEALPAEIMDDPRIVVVPQASDAAAAQLRRAGVEASTSRFIVFLAAGDSVGVDAAKRLHRHAVESESQLVGFTVTTVRHDGGATKSSPSTRTLQGNQIVNELVPRDEESDLTPGRVMFAADLLKQAYGSIPATQPLLDDRAIVLLAYASATSYSSLSGVDIRRPAVAETPADGAQLVSALEQASVFKRVEPSIRKLARMSPDPAPLLDGYAAGHLTTIAEALRTFAALPRGEREAQRELMRAHIDDLDAVSAAVTLAPETLPALIEPSEARSLESTPVRSVLLTTNVLTTGGVSGVLLTQARILIAAGYRVTIATHRAGSAESLVPDGATLVQLTGTSRRQRVEQWARLCRRHDVDVVIDHRILYSRDWPAFALAARATGAATIGWFHNFAGRPTYNGNELQTLLQRNLGALAHLVVLSPLDVAFWKLRGIHHVSYLPNPPSPFLLGTTPVSAPKPAPRDRPIELIWWGRLEEHTKKVSQLVEVAAALQRLGVDFRLRIIGPDWADMTAERLGVLAAKHGVAERVEVTGPLHGDDLLRAIDSSDVFVNTSIIEGYPLTLPEAQSRGVPIVMYDLPWLALSQNNAGVIATPQQDPDALAAALADLALDPQQYERMSRASLEAAARATSYDFAKLYEQLLSGQLPPEHSPEPTLDDGRKVLELLVFFAERSTPPPRSTTGPVASRSAAARRQQRPRSVGERIERKLTPIGRRVVDAAPWLRPVAGNLKHMLLRR